MAEIKLQEVAYAWAGSFSSVEKISGDKVFTREEALSAVLALGSATEGFNPYRFIPKFALRTAAKRSELSDDIARFVKEQFEKRLHHTTLPGRINFILFDDSFYGSSVVFFVSKQLDTHTFGVTCFYPSKFDELGRKPFALKGARLADTCDRIFVDIDWGRDTLTIDVGIRFDSDKYLSRIQQRSQNVCLGNETRSGNTL